MMRVLRFGLVGVAGAVVHIGAFWLMQHLAGLGNSPAWILAFFIAATSTWVMNRTFTFQDRANAEQAAEWLRYLAIAGGGAVAHFAAFHLAIRFLTLFAQHPALAIVPGSLASFVVTYAGASLLVFRKARKNP
jgi:putative flippase GtrA